MILFYHNLFDTILEISPWIFLGSLVAGILYIFIPSNFLYHHLGLSKGSHIIKASLLGVPIPLCSCAVLPTAVGMRENGASKSACMSFLVSTPQTGIDSIFVTSSFFSLPFALFKLISAFILGIIAGFIYMIFFEKKNKNVERKKKDLVHVKIDKNFKNVISYAIRIMRSFWKWLVIGIILSSLMTTLIPPSFFQKELDISLIASMSIALLISLPLYICATSSIPIAMALITAGFPPSAALVFLIAGPATNIVSISVIYKTFGKYFLLVYLFVIIVGSFLLGYFFDFLLNDFIIKEASTHHHYSFFSYGLAGLFILLMIYYFYIDFIKRSKKICSSH